MNLNVKPEGEEEQTIQYVNRFAINIPSTAFNLNIVNSGLNNQSYILNPVNPVGQNIVAYQSPMAVQSYFTLPTESESNIIHSLPVGVPVPVGLPVQTGFLQNHNFVNTSIIIGNEDCNSHGILDSSPNHVDQVDDIKPNYFQKSIKDLLNTSESQNIGPSSSPHLNVENAIKKPCPLEMSIKAANIDIEFEKCESEIPLLVENNLEINDEKINCSTLNNSENESSKISLNVTSIQEINEVSERDCKLKNKKTEITWENNTVKEDLSSNDFQESLICEVEEVNDDEGEDDDYGESFNCKNNIESEENECRMEKETSSEESDVLPLSVALKLKKLSDSKNKSAMENKRCKKGKSESALNKTGNKEKSKSKKYRKDVEVKNLSDEWSESDDDILNLKRIKNEFSYKCFFEPKTAKSTSSLVLKIEDSSKKFSRVRSCCSKKECSKKISVKDQMIAHKFFYDLESNSKRDSYLINCIEHVQKNKSLLCKNVKEKNDNYLQNLDDSESLVNPNIRLEIENESNGNQKLSDEIQNAINESLKDCIQIGVKNNDKANECNLPEESHSSDKEEKNNWNYYIIIDRCKKKVCLQFLLKLLRITKSRIKQLQKKILSGTPSLEESQNTTNHKDEQIWEMAKWHLDSLLCEEPINCHANPRHKFLSKISSKEELFVNFKKFYLHHNGKELIQKFPAYKRFLDKETSVSFLPPKNGVCSQCEDSKLRKKQNRNNKDSVKLQKSKSGHEGKTKKKKSNLDPYISDDESSLKCKKLKLTIPLKGINNSNKIQQKQSKRNFKSKCGDKKGNTKLFKEKTKQSSKKGRDVWSLMLLHLETMPYKECNACTNKKKHRFLNSTFTTQGLFEDYRKYFLKETNSELGLGFTMYEKYFNRNCNYTILDINEEENICPRCATDQLRS